MSTPSSLREVGAPGVQRAAPFPEDSSAWEAGESEPAHGSGGAGSSLENWHLGPGDDVSPNFKLSIQTVVTLIFSAATKLQGTNSCNGGIFAHKMTYRQSLGPFFHARIKKGHFFHIWFILAS